MGPPPEEPGEGPPLDVARIIRTFDRHDVEYILVGGAAALSYGAQRLTQDIDCVLDHGDAANLDRLGEAMRELGARIRAPDLADDIAKTLPANLDARSFRQSELSTWTTDAGALDVLANIPDRDGTLVTFGALNQRAETVQAHDVSIRVAGLEDIIASKEWADRPKDHEALGELYAIRAARAAADLAQTCFPDPARGTAPPTPKRDPPGHPGAAPGRDSDVER